MSPATSQLFPNQKWGHYTIIEKLGEGGMGQVYKVWDHKLKRHVALKLMLNKRLNSEIQTKRFLKEAQITAKLNHPNIIKLYEINKFQGVVFFTMTYIEGECLSHKISELSTIQKAEIVCKLAEILKYAHEQGIIHLDLKPGNIVLNEKLEPFILDFGLAKNIQADYRLTKTGAILGTPYYMSPEQALGKRKLVDHQSDIYSLGIILYELLTDQIPFQGSTMGIILKQVVSKIPTFPRKIDSSIPKDLETICLKCIAKKKQDRYADGQLLAYDLKKFLSGDKIWARHAYGFLRRNVYLFILLCVALITSISITTMLPPPSTPPKSLYSFKKIVDTKPSTESLLNYIQALIDRRLYHEVVIELHKISQNFTGKSRKVLDKQWVIAYAGIKNFTNALRHYENIVASERDDVQLHLTMVKAHYNLQNFKKANNFLKKLKRYPDYQSQYNYYKAMVAYKNNNYKFAYSFFQKIDKNISPEVYLHAGICEFYLNDLENSLKSLTKAQEIFPDIPQGYEFTGKIYRKQKRWWKAIPPLQNCIKLEPKNSDYHLALANVYNNLKRHKKASQSAYKAMQLSRGNYKAMRTFLRSRYSMGEGLDLHNIIKEYMDKSYEYVTPELFSQEITQIKQRYRDYYLEWLSLQNKTGNLDSLFNAILQDKNASTYQIAMQGLVALRYHPSLEHKFVLLLNSAKSEQKNQIRFAQQAILKQKITEQKFVLYYLLAEFSENNNIETRKILSQKQWLAKIEQTLQNPKESSLIRFLCTKAILSLLLIDKIESFSAHPDVTIATLAICALQQKGLMKYQNEKLIQVSKKNPNDMFLQFLVAQNLQPIPKNKVLLKKFLSSTHPRIVLATAGNLIQQYKKTRDYWKTSKDKILMFMNHNSAMLRQYAHAKFWKVFLKRKLWHYKEYTKYFRKGLGDKDKNVFLTLIYFVYKMEIPGCQKIFAEMSKSSDPMKRVFSISLLAIQDNEHPKILKIIKNTKEDFIIRQLALTAPIASSFDTSFHEKKYGLKTALTQIIKLKKILANLSKDPDKNFRITLAYLKAPIGLANLEDIQNETDAKVLANILLTTTIKSEFVTLGNSQPSQRQIQNFAKKYTSHKSSLVREIAYAVYITTLPEKQHKKIYQKYQKAPDKIVRKGVARGFHLLAKNFIHNQMSFREKISTYHTSFSVYINKLKNLPSKQRQKLIQWLSWSIELYSKSDRCYFERAILNNVENKISEAYKDINQAILLEPENFLYHLIQATILLKMDKKLFEKKTVEIVERSYVEEGKTLWRLTPHILPLYPSKKIHKILLLSMLNTYVKTRLLNVARVYCLYNDKEKAMLFLRYFSKLKKETTKKYSDFQKETQHFVKFGEGKLVDFILSEKIQTK